MKPVWQFNPDPDNEWVGINESGVETFNKRPLISLAREIPQNSKDERCDPSKPTSLTFQLKEIPPEEIPGRDSLLKKIIDCLADPKNHGDKRTREALNNARAALERSRVRVLIVSEQNTKGMSGPAHDPDSNWYAYTKSRGMSAKDSPNSLGSFGIGKMAPIANSDARSLLISTKYIEKKSGSMMQLLGGVSFLTTHRDASQNYIKGTGRFGFDGEPSNQIHGVPEWLQRDEIGTTFAILGFPETDDWESVVASTIASTFFPAIRESELVANVVTEGDKTIEINATSLPSLLEFYSKGEGAKTLAELHRVECIEQADLAGKMCLALDQGETFYTQDKSFGNIRVNVVVDSDLGQTVGFIRDGMFITTGAKSKFPSLRVFSNCKEFAAVVECQSENGRQLLREFEPPEHDSFVATRVADGLPTLRRLGRNVKAQLDKVIKIDLSQARGLDFTAELFGGETDEEGAGRDSASADINPEGVVKWNSKTVKLPQPKINVPIIEPNDHNTAVEDEDTIEHTELDDSDEFTPSPPPGARKPIEIQGVRVVKRDQSTLSAFFTIPFTGTYRISLWLSGQDSDEIVKIRKAGDMIALDNEVSVSCKAGQRNKIDIELDRVPNGAFKVIAYEV